MARITVEDCIDKFDSRFELVLVASNRARKLHSGEEPTVERDNDKNTMITLKENADETNSSEVIKQELIFSTGSRVRDVETGPDGFIYVAIEDPGRIIRLKPIKI